MLFEYLQQAGWWMTPIVACSIVTVAIVLERSLFWLWLGARSDRRLRRDLRGGMTPIDRLQRSSDVIASIVREFLRHSRNRAAAAIATDELLSRSERHLRLLAVIASVSTSFGLLGTVVGVSISFRALADARDIAGGLSIALYTTVGGLVVFLIAYLAGALFQALSRGLAREIELTLDRLEPKNRRVA
ncbi:MAG: MotA/TolQ/ExbB proton channel family protein [Planctomycetota bacterium]